MGSRNSARRFNISNWFSRNGASIYSTLKRFPLTAFFLVALASALIYANELSLEQTTNILPTLNRVIGTLVFGVALSLFFTMVKERFQKSLSIVAIALQYVVQLALLYLFYEFVFINTEMVPVVTLGFSTVALLLGFVFVPYLFDDGIEIYTTKLISKVAVSGFFTLSITLGIFAVFAGIQALLFKDLNSDLYYYTFIIAITMFAPIHFLSSLPYGAERYKLRDYNWVLRVAFTYIALPLLSVYTIILYIYFGKVLITQTWPSGIVSYLVVSYTAIGIITVFLLAPFLKSNRWVRSFTAVFSKVIFPLLGMMFFAIGLRINQYGFTENRYFVLVIGIWATLVMIYININKGRRNILFIISLAITLLIAVYGPLSAFNVSMASQNNRFNAILTKYNMIENGKVVNRNASIADIDKREISNILYYFHNNHNYKDLKALPQDFKNTDMKKLFGFEEYYNIPKTESKAFYYNRGDSPLSIADYDILFDIFVSSYSDSVTEEYISGDSRIKLSFKDSIMSVLKNDIEVMSVNLNDHTKTLYDKYGVIHKGDFIPDELTFFAENEFIKVKFIYSQVNGYVDDDEAIQLRNLQGKILIKIEN